MQSSHQANRVFLTGMKHTGKSILAKLVARQMNREVIDLDDEIGRLYLAESGRQTEVREIFRLDNGKTFQRLEAEACRVASGVAYPVIVATGGGLCDNARAVTELSTSMNIALDATPEILFARIIRKGIPAFLSATSRSEAWAEFEALYRRRSVKYRAMADVVVEVSDRPPAEIVAELVIRIEERLHGGQ